MTLYEINTQFAEAIELYENGVDEVVDTETGEACIKLQMGYTVGVN